MIFIDSSILTQLLTLCKGMIELQFYGVYFIVQEIKVVLKPACTKDQQTLDANPGKQLKKHGSGQTIDLDR